MAKIISPDLVLSYWILVWFVLYYNKLTKYSPVFLLYVGFWENLAMLTIMILYKVELFRIVVFVIVNTFIKVVPLFLLRERTIVWDDIYVSIVVVTIYGIWVYIRLGKSIFGVQQHIMDAFLKNEYQTPIMSLAYSIKKYLS